MNVGLEMFTGGLLNLTKNNLINLTIKDGVRTLDVLGGEGDLDVLGGGGDLDFLGGGGGHSLALNIIKALVLVTIIILAIFSNLLVILAIILYRRLRGINNYFLVSLALADLLVAAAAMTLNATQEISGRWIFGPLVCDLWNSIDVHVSTVSTLHLCCISLDRYYAIVRPFEYQTTITTRVAVMMMVVAWVSPTLISFVPIFLGWYTTSEHIKERELNPWECRFEVNKPYAFISSTLTFWCPVLVMLLTYHRVYVEAMRQKRTIERFSSINVVNARKISDSNSNDKEKQRDSRYRESAVSWKEQSIHAIEGSLSNLSNISEAEGENPGALLRDKMKKRSNTPIEVQNDQQLEKNGRSPDHNRPAPNRKRNSLGNVLIDVKIRARLSIVTSTLAITEGLRERKRLHSSWRREHKAFVTLGVVLGAFLLCWLPFMTWYLTTTICGKEQCPCPDEIVSVLFWIGYFNSTLNPLIYAMTNQDFKIAFINILRRIVCCKPPENNQLYY